MFIELNNSSSKKPRRSDISLPNTNDMSLRWSFFFRLCILISYKHYAPMELSNLRSENKKFMKENLKQFIAVPKNTFLIDAFGAILTAFLLFFVLRTFNTFFGLSKTTLEYLSLLAVFFSVYSFSCFFLIINNWKSYLKIICIANVFYCLLTLGIILYYFQSISVFGIAYFLGEILAIVGLIFLEIRIIRGKT